MASLTLPLPENSHILVQKGSEVTAGTTLARGKHSGWEDSLEIATLLAVPAKQVTRYLTCSIGARVRRGETIARRRKFFTEMLVRAPYDATISSVDLTKGEVLLKGEGKSAVVKSPVAATISRVGPDEIEIEFSGQVIEVEIGVGWAQGKLAVFNQKEQFSIDRGVKGKIVVIGAVTTSIFAKLAALEAAGTVIKVDKENIMGELLFNKQKLPLPFVAISTKLIKHFTGFAGKKAVLDGQRKYVLIID